MNANSHAKTTRIKFHKLHSFLRFSHSWWNITKWCLREYFHNQFTLQFCWKLHSIVSYSLYIFHGEESWVDAFMFAPNAYHTYATYVQYIQSHYKAKGSVDTTISKCHYIYDINMVCFACEMCAGLIWPNGRSEGYQSL